MAVFSPQSKAPKESYLDELRSYLCGKAELRPLLDGIDRLPQIWAIFARHNSSIAELTQGARYTQALSDWVIKGNSSSISNVMSGILSLPLLTIIQVVQYFQFLEVKKLRHCDFMHRLRDRGGIQGYCGGLMPAIAIACKYCLVSFLFSLGSASRRFLQDRENVVNSSHFYFTKFPLTAAVLISPFRRLCERIRSCYQCC